MLVSTVVLGNCAKCKKDKKLKYFHPTAKPRVRICSGCYQTLTQKKARCPSCGRQRRLPFKAPTGSSFEYICRSCHEASTKHKVTCPECGRKKYLRSMDPNDRSRRICNSCRSAIKAAGQKCSQCGYLLKRLHNRNPIEPSKGWVCEVCWNMFTKGHKRCTEC